MGIVLWHTTMSLDGFVAGPDHDMDWMFRSAEPVSIPEAEAVRHTTGAILGGRNGYDLANRPGTPPEARKPFGGAWTGPVFVLTHRPVDDDDPDFHFLSGDIHDAVGRAKEAAGDRDVLVLGADTARQCVEAGLIDEILVHVIPVLLGDGIRFYPGTNEIGLETISITSSGPIANLRFRPRLPT